MATINRLCIAFRQITINKQRNIIARYCSSNVYSKERNNDSFSNFSKNAMNIAFTNVNIKFIPKTLNIDFGNPDSTTKKNINEIPLSKYIPSMEEPLTKQPIQQDLPLIDKSFQLPSIESISEKLAIHLIRIRRKKIRKHKRKKLRKRMQFVWAKIRAKRNALKEKLFQAELIAKIKEAENFDAKTYVEERLFLFNKEILPKTYRGEILPEDMIRKFIEEKKEQVERRKNRLRLKLDE